MSVLSLARIQRHAAALGAARDFYSQALGFQAVGTPAENPALAQLLGLSHVTTQRLQLGSEVLELCETTPAPSAFPAKLAGNDLRFQHIAIVTTDMRAAYQHLQNFGITPLSPEGPHRLPAASGGVIAFKFYDPEGHPLELLQFPHRPAGQSLFTGFDHSAITVSNPAHAVAFYQNLGLDNTSRQLNHGPEQDALDALPGAETDVLALSPQQATPHLELLHYRHPTAAAITWQARDPRADRVVFSTTETGFFLTRDPDGHEAVLEGPP